MPNLAVETNSDEQGPSGSAKNEERVDEEKEDRQPEEPMEQDPDEVGKDDDKASIGGASSLDFNFFDEDVEGAETLAGTTEPAENENSTLKPPSASMNAARNLQESSSPGKIGATTKKFSEPPRRRVIEGAARVPFLGTLSEEEWEDHYRDHESRTGCDMDRIAFSVQEVWTVV